MLWLVVSSGIMWLVVYLLVCVSAGVCVSAWGFDYFSVVVEVVQHNASRCKVRKLDLLIDVVTAVTWEPRKVNSTNVRQLLVQLLKLNRFCVYSCSV